MPSLLLCEGRLSCRGASAIGILNVSEQRAPGKLLACQAVFFLGQIVGFYQIVPFFYFMFVLFDSILSSLLFALLLRGRRNSPSKKEFISSRENVTGT